MPYKYFEQLDIKPTNSIAVVKEAYKKQLFLWHPDRLTSNGKLNFQEANDKTAKINEAYEKIIQQLKYDTKFDEIIANVKYCWETKYKQNGSSFVDDSGIESSARSSVVSSNVEWIEYYADLEILIVKFKKSGAYLYEAVPENVFSNLRSASSKGKYLNKHIAFCYAYHKLSVYSDWQNYAKEIYSKNRDT